MRPTWTGTTTGSRTARSGLCATCSSSTSSIARSTGTAIATVNLRFAHAVADEAERCSGQVVVWIQDYHFSLVPALLRAMRPQLFIHQFWHIPFPPPDILQLLPSRTHEAVLRGMLGNDLVEFQIERYAANFLECVARFVPEARVDRANQIVHFRDRVVHVGAFPISIDVDAFREDGGVAVEPRARRQDAARPLRDGQRANWECASTGSTTRRAFSSDSARSTRLWTESSELREQFTFIFVCTPSRSEVPAYTTLERTSSTP